VIPAIALVHVKNHLAPEAVVFIHTERDFGDGESTSISTTTNAPWQKKEKQQQEVGSIYAMEKRKHGGVWVVCGTNLITMPPR